MGSIEDPCITSTLFTEHPLSDAEQETVRDRIRFFLSLDDDLRPFYTIGRTDPAVEPIIKALYGLHQPKFLTPQVSDTLRNCLLVCSHTTHPNRDCAPSENGTHQALGDQSSSARRNLSCLPRTTTHGNGERGGIGDDGWLGSQN